MYVRMMKVADADLDRRGRDPTLTVADVSAKGCFHHLRPEHGVAPSASLARRLQSSADAPAAGRQQQERLRSRAGYPVSETGLAGSQRGAAHNPAHQADAVRIRVGREVHVSASPTRWMAGRCVLVLEDEKHHAGLLRFVGQDAITLVDATHLLGVPPVDEELAALTGWEASVEGSQETAERLHIRIGLLAQGKSPPRPGRA
jgi:hypothetical protein